MALLERGQDGDEDYVRKELFTGDPKDNFGGLIGFDLDWVLEHWQEEGCDLWEEVRSADFFWNQYTLRAGLDIGAKLARRLGHKELALHYEFTKDDVTGTLLPHYEGGFVYESRNRRKDAAVIEAFNVGDLGDDYFNPLSPEVLGTVRTLNELFCSDLAVNQIDNLRGLPGVLYGRYEGDTYDGGNAWVLLSASLARLIYRQAADALQRGAVGAVVLAKAADELLQKAYGFPAGLFGADLGDALLGAGDGVLVRVRDKILGSKLHMAEQISREDGHMSSARDLTWNYANVLLAMRERDIYLKLRN